MQHPEQAAPQATTTLAAEPASVAEARSWSLPLLVEWGIDGCSPDALLVLDELVTNAIVHGTGPVSLRLVRLPGCVRVEVTDGGGGTVLRRHPEPTDTGGRGLVVVDHLCSRWGVEPHRGSGKTVWAELRV